MIYTVTFNPALDRCYRIGSLAVGEVNKVIPVSFDAGGKGINVSKTVSIFGVKTACCTLAGGDTGDILVSMLNRMSIPVMSYRTDGVTRTNIKITDDEGHTTDINEPGPLYDEQGTSRLVSDLLAAAGPSDIVVLSGSLPPDSPSDLYMTIIESLRLNGCRVFLDTSGSALEAGIQGRPYFVKPNAAELGIKSDVGEALDSGLKLVESGIPNVIVSLGREGSVYCNSDGLRLYGHAIPVPAKCTTGGGDGMTAGFAVATAKKMTGPEAFKFSIACATAAVFTQGTGAPDRKTVDEYLSKVVAETI